MSAISIGLYSIIWVKYWIIARWWEIKGDWYTKWTEELIISELDKCKCWGNRAALKEILNNSFKMLKIDIGREW